MGGRNIRVHGIRLPFVTGSPLFPIFPPLINKECTTERAKATYPLLPVLSKTNTYDFNAVAGKFPPHVSPLLRHNPEE